jgi:hypothetical protein
MFELSGVLRHYPKGGSWREGTLKSICILCLLLGAACGEKKSEPIVAEKVVQKHEHQPPHGGTPVELGAEEFHLELVLDAPTGKMQAFIMDGELEKFVRIPAESIEFTVKLAGRDEPLILKAVANNATGEKVGDTSLFEAQTDGLKTTSTFDATLKQISINGHEYQNVSFNFPKGNDTDEKAKK